MPFGVFCARLPKAEFGTSPLEAGLQLYSKGYTLPVSLPIACNISLPLEKMGEASWGDF